jgi:hypothetical protein
LFSDIRGNDMRHCEAGFEPPGRNKDAAQGRMVLHKQPLIRRTRAQACPAFNDFRTEKTRRDIASPLNQIIKLIVRIRI